MVKHKRILICLYDLHVVNPRSYALLFVRRYIYARILNRFASRLRVPYQRCQVSKYLTAQVQYIEHIALTLFRHQELYALEIVHHIFPKFPVYELRRLPSMRSREYG